MQALRWINRSDLGAQDGARPRNNSGTGRPIAATSDFERGLRLRGDGAERGRVADREVGEHLPVELDAGLRAAVHELVVREPVAARGRVDPGDPEAPEVTLPDLAVAVGVDERAVDLLLGVAVV